MKRKQTSFGEALRSRPWLYNLTWIAGILLTLAVAAHLAMQIGTRHGARRTVPDFTGIVLDDAVRLAARNDLELFVNDSLFVPAYEGGIVLDQLPECGVEVKPGRTVYVTINSFRQKMVDIPYVAGRSLRQAKNMLEIAGLEIAELVYRPDMAENYVLEEYYDGSPVLEHSRRQAEMGSGVTLCVGIGEHPGAAYVPLLAGLGLRQAKGRLWESGLNVGEIRFDEGINLLNQKEARVYMQQPAVGTPVGQGSTVSLRLTLDEKLVARNRAEAEKAAAEAEKMRQEFELLRADSLAQVQLEEALSGGREEADSLGAQPAESGDAAGFDEFFN